MVVVRNTSVPQLERCCVETHRKERKQVPHPTFVAQNCDKCIALSNFDASLCIYFKNIGPLLFIECCITAYVSLL